MKLFRRSTRWMVAALLTTGSIAQAADKADLIKLYEEEVLAHDLYVTLGKSHKKLMPLQNIPHSELRHQKAMAEILKNEGIKLPKAPKGQRFMTPGLDETYNSWLKEGLKSEANACLVGTRLEDYDIADLRNAQAAFPQHRDVLSQLERASNNHLRAFHRNLVARGGTYKAQALAAGDLKKILSAKGGCGGNGKGNGKGKGKGKQKGKGGGECGECRCTLAKGGGNGKQGQQRDRSRSGDGSGNGEGNGDGQKQRKRHQHRKGQLV